MFPRAASALAGPTPGNFGKFRYGEIVRPMVAEHANVPSRCLRPYGPTPGNFGKFRYGEIVRLHGIVSPDDVRSLGEFPLEGRGRSS